jgi:hypothetical protein
VPYRDNYWSNSFGPKCDPPVFGVLHLPKYFGNLSNFISHAIPKFQKTSVIDRGNTTSDPPSVHQVGPDDVLMTSIGGCYTMSFPIAQINLIVAEAIGQL